MMAFSKAADELLADQLGEKPVAASGLIRAMRAGATRRWIVGVCLTLAALAGCDLTGQYDKKFHEALDAASKRAVFDLVRPDFTDALDPAKAPVGVKLRLPAGFDNSSKPFKLPALPSLPGMP